MNFDSNLVNQTQTQLPSNEIGYYMIGLYDLREFCTMTLKYHNMTALRLLQMSEQ